MWILEGDAVHVLSGMLIDPALGSDLQARYALSSLANYVARPGAESEKRAFETALLSEIQKDHSHEVQSFLMEQLRLSASDRSVPVLESFLTHDRLYNDALRVFLIIDSPAAANSIRQSLPASEGPKKVALIKALGELKDRQSVEMIQHAAGSDQWPLVRMSLFALSNIGEPGASSLFEQAIDTNSGFRQSEIISYYAGYAEALLESGYAAESDVIAEYFLKGEFPAHIKSSALQIRFQVQGEEIVDELIQIAQNSEQILATSALRLINELEGEEITNKLIDGFEESSSESNATYFIEALGDRGDLSAVSVLRDQSEHSSSEIRLAALQALHQIQDEVEPELAIGVLDKANTDQEIEQIENLLLQLEPDVVVPVAAKSLTEVSSKTKPVLIDLLATYRANDHKTTVLNEWDSDEEAVRVAVYDYLGVVGNETDADLLVERFNDDISDDELQFLQTALASVLNRSVAETERDQLFRTYYNNGSNLQKARLTSTVPHIDGMNTVDIIETSLRHSNAQVQSASMEVMGMWNSTDILPLFTLAVSKTSGEDQLALIKNFTQIIHRSDKSLSEKETLIHDLFSAIEGNHYKIELLNHLAESSELLTLQTLTQYVNHEREEIREASVRILSDILEPHYSGESEQLNLPNGILAVLNEEIRDKVKDELVERSNSQNKNQEDQEAESEPLFGSLFNGENLDGWQVIGNQESWGVEDGILYTDGAGSGWISTEGQYDDFIIELEYRVPEGGNSGLFLRAPHEGNPANEGLEIQILDDYAERYADLKPWQYTGSIYFEQAVSKRVTKPAGEWQSMKVRAEGPNIQVTLNGEQIINANLIQYMENAPNHPGLLKRSGYIGLQNHGDRVDFRNIKITGID
ncbi:MAG: family 16 glycoside hydrolase [Balneolaceae bacterium]|nr:family 16 glycoside hydrolase [Balneolaceae bacterium]